MVELSYGAPTRLPHCSQSLHCGTVLLGTNAASTSRCSHHTVEWYYGAPTLLSHHQQSEWYYGVLHFAHHHCTVELYYRAPTLPQHSQPSLHSEAVLWGTNEALTLPAVITLWSCIMGHQLCFNIACSHHTVHGGAVLWGTNAASTSRSSHCMVEWYYGAPTLL